MVERPADLGNVPTLLAAPVGFAVLGIHFGRLPAVDTQTFTPPAGAEGLPAEDDLAVTVGTVHRAGSWGGALAGGSGNGIQCVGIAPLSDAK